MRVLILTHGSRGDVQPFIALAKYLTEVGNEVILGAPAKMAPVADAYGIAFVPFDDLIVDFIRQPKVREATQHNFHGLRGKILKIQYIREVRHMMVHIMDEMAKMAEYDADVVVHLFEQPGHEIAEQIGVPAVPVCLQPYAVPTRSFPNRAFPFRVPSSLNRASYQWTKLVLRLRQGSTARWRRETLKLPRRRAHRNPLRNADGTPATVLQAFSRHMLPAPLDYPDSVHTTGFWFLPTPPNWIPTADVSAFLRAGDPPVYVGFGSISGSDPHRTGRIILDAVRCAGVRAVVASGWGGIEIGNVSQEVLLIDEAPHEWLFRRMSAVVHHGGAGTTAAALASGRPQVVCPFMGDQMFHAQRMRAIGVAPEPQPQRTLNAISLARAIRQAVTDPILASNARSLGEQVRAEDGVREAAKILESVVSAQSVKP